MKLRGRGIPRSRGRSTFDLRPLIPPVADFYPGRYIGAAVSTPEPATSDLRNQLQATLGDAYALERELGGGGMSRVFLAFDKALSRRVVVKVLLPDLAAGVSSERFRREIQLVAKLQHPHIVPIHSAGESLGLPYFTMPFVEGESLRARIDRDGELPIPETVRLLRDVAAALAYAHSQGVIHRDIKPDNVLITAGSAVVADFGVAKALSESATNGQLTTITSTGMALGTPAYMAPEQAVGDPAMDHRVDIYAFGLTAYEMLAGKSPFTGRSPQAVLAAQVTEDPVPIQTLRPSTPAILANLVARCLAKHAIDRPATAEEVLHVLDSMATPSGGLVPTSATLRARRSDGSADRRAWAWGIGVAAVVVVAFAGAAGGVFLARRPRAPVLARSADSTPPPATAVTPAAPKPAAMDTEAAPAAADRTVRHAPAPPPPAPPSADSLLAVRLRAAALVARQAAADAGVGADRLARGDSLLAGADSLRRAGHVADAGVAYSAAGAAWTAAAQAARPAVATSPPASPPQVAAQPSAPAPVADPRPAIEAAVAQYAKAIESRNTDRIRRVYPGLTAVQERDWKQFFDAVGDIKAALALGDLRVNGASATATATGTYQYDNSTTHRQDEQPVTIRMTFSRDSSGTWIISAIH